MDKNIAAFVQLGTILLNATMGFEAAGWSRREAMVLAFEFVYRKAGESQGDQGSDSELMNEALKRFLGTEKPKKDGEEDAQG